MKRFVGFGGANPEVLIALNSSYQSGILLYYIVNNDASSQQLQIIIITANNNATSIYTTSVDYISAGLDDMQLSRTEV